MFIFSLSIKNLLRNKRKTFVLGLLIATTSLLVFVMNAIFERTNTGLKSLFVQELTGTYLIAENSEKINSIFGYEMPLVSEYEPVEQLQAFLPISEKLAQYEDALAYTPIISAAARLQVAGERNTVPLFGIDTESYFNVFQNIHIEKGDIDLLSPGNKGIFLNSSLADSIEQDSGRPLEIGESIQLTTYSNGSFRIRKGVFAGVHSYSSSSEPFDKVVLCDPQLLRELLNYSNATDLDANTEDASLMATEENLDDLFSDFSSDFEITEEKTGEEVLDSIDNLFASTADNEIDFSSIITWSFISITPKKDVSDQKIKNILEEDVLLDTDVQVMYWKTSAGLSAQAPMALQTAVGIGMGFIIIGAVLVIMNGLLLSVLERTNEIGTMRAIGASNSFIKRLYSTELMILILSFTIIGILLGFVICMIMQAYPIILSNSFLITLFGSQELIPLVSTQLIGIQLLVSVCIAFSAWQYPVALALSVEPAKILGKNV